MNVTLDGTLEATDVVVDGRSWREQVSGLTQRVADVEDENRDLRSDNADLQTENQDQREQIEALNETTASQGEEIRECARIE